LDYSGAIDWLFNMRRFGPVRTLFPMRELVERLDHPEVAFRSVHITGTNGKGSTSAFAASILRAQGYSVGLYTSPHLERFTERIVVDGVEIPEAEVARIASRLCPIVEEMAARGGERPLFFDVVTAMAFVYFAERRVDVAVLEVGMGGRLDATNIVTPLVSAITNVSLEHTQVLGNTVLEIAGEKAGIVKPSVPLVTATPDDSVYSLLAETCRKLGSEITRVGTDVTYDGISSNLDGQRFTVKGLRGTYTLSTTLLGPHQQRNAATAVAVAEVLAVRGMEVSSDAIVRGVREAKWPGRMEVVQREPLVVLDCAKDAEAARALAEAVRLLPHGRLIAVVSISADKNIRKMVGHLAKVADSFVVTSHSVMGRAADRRHIGAEIERQGKPWVEVERVGDAVERALAGAGKGDMVLVTGSVFAVGEARRRWSGNP